MSHSPEVKAAFRELYLELIGTLPEQRKDGDGKRIAGRPWRYCKRVFSIPNRTALRWTAEIDAEPEASDARLRVHADAMDAAMDAQEPAIRTLRRELRAAESKDRIAAAKALNAVPYLLGKAGAKDPVDAVTERPDIVIVYPPDVAKPE